MSNSQAKRLLKQGAIEINGVVSKDPKYIVKPGDKIRVGKKIFLIAK